MSADRTSPTTDEALEQLRAAGRTISEAITRLFSGDVLRRAQANMAERAAAAEPEEETPTQRDLRIVRECPPGGTPTPEQVAAEQRLMATPIYRPTLPFSFVNVTTDEDRAAAKDRWQMGAEFSADGYSNVRPRPHDADEDLCWCNFGAGAGAADGEVRVVDPTTGGEKGSKLARFDLVPVGALHALAEHYGRGARKYADRNWERGYAWSLSYAALLRHLTAWWAGEDIDTETGSHHLDAVMWHAFALRTFVDQHPAGDNRPTS